MNSLARSIQHRFVSDPRHYQIACLACLVGIGIGWLEFDIRTENALTMILTSLAVQYGFTKLLGLPHFDARSPLISALSLCLLLRTSSIAVAALAATIAIGSKFIVRWKGKHLFNPTNLALVIVVVLADNAWISSGQWGSAVWSCFLFACLGGLTANRSSRTDISLMVMGGYAALLFGRALWLGDPMAIPVHQIQNGALLLFAFFMISDPKTTPDSRAGRFVFASLVVAIAGWVQFGLFTQNGLNYGLVVMALFVPLIDRCLPGNRFEWKPTGPSSPSQSKGISHVNPKISPNGMLPVPHAAR